MRAAAIRLGLPAAVLALLAAAPPPLPPAGGGQDPVPAPTLARSPRPVDVPPGVLDQVPFTRWRTFTTADGLPADRAFAVRLDGDRVWVGTEAGLARYEAGRWRVFGTGDGLPHPVVLSLDVSPRTGDLWIGTMGGLARLSAGRIDAFTQIDSGLSNDFVNAVRCDPDQDAVWAATAMGVSRLDLRTSVWTIFTQANTPMHEPWTYSVAIGDGAVYVGAWGAGVLEYNPSSGGWREYRDPDREFEIDLFPDDGPVSDVTAGVDYGGGLLWQATYSGAARYDGRNWRSYFAEDSGLAGNFINFVRAQGRHAWLATDRGLSLTDGEDWATYVRREDGRGEIRFFTGAREIARSVTSTAPAHNYVLGVDARGDEVWVATAGGVSRGIRAGPAGPGTRPRAASSPGRPDTDPAQGTREPVGLFRYAGTPDPLQPFRGRRPYREFFTERTEFRGPGRERPEPPELDQVRIGFIGPLEDQDNPVLPPGARSGVRHSPKAVFGRRMLRAATLAVAEANARGGYRGIPFQPVPRSDLVLWGQTSNEMVRFAFDDRVWAVLSAIDSNHNHVLSRATLKTEVPIVNAGSTDPTLVEHAIPWLIRCVIDDRQQAFALLNQIYRRNGHRRVALLRVNDRDGRTGVEEFLQGARRLGHPVAIEQRFENGDTEFRGPLERIRETDPDALVVWGNPGEAGRAVRQARALGLGMPIFGFDRMAETEFLDAAGPAAEGATVTAILNPDRDDPLWIDFRSRYQARFGEDPDAFAAYAYDGMNLILDAIRRAGLNRARIRDALFALRTYHGVTGKMIFDTNLNNIASPWLAVVENGRFRYFAPPAWDDAESGPSAPGLSP